MKKSTDEIRTTFLDFFEKKGHKIISSSSLIPKLDKTLLFTNAGMNQFKDIFLGKEKSTYFRAATSQRCIRVGGKHNDLENVGYTKNHHTFFEMLGNFSFGDYFKKDAISYAWELLTSENWFHLPKERFFVTVYKKDKESLNIWKKNIGISSDHITSIGDNKLGSFYSENFWQMGDTGPCGPCTEIFYDYRNQWNGIYPGSRRKKWNGYIEIWNIVFIQFHRVSEGMIKPLSKKSVDTGMGLERIASVLQNVHSNYDIDIFRTIIHAIKYITGFYNKEKKYLCVIADHIRSCAFLISDGVVLSNENRGYVLRRIIRRAICHGHIIGAKNFFYKLVAPLIYSMGSTAHELISKKKIIEKILKNEEKNFSCTLDRGLKILYEELAKLPYNTFHGKNLFRLYDTYGFPFYLTKEVCRETGIKIEKKFFEKSMNEQRDRARKEKKFHINYNHLIHVNSASLFCGYDYFQKKSQITELFHNNKSIHVIHSGEKAIVILQETPFYGESGGQIGDKGLLNGIMTEFVVNDTQRYNNAIGHLGNLVQGKLQVKDYVNAVFDNVHRHNICLNHSSTHLLHSALREILGYHVIQKGSLITNKYLRFDFSHLKVMNHSQIRNLEDLVNKQIRRNLLVKKELMNINDTKNIIALFKKKYNTNVIVLSIGDFSKELCGGTHVNYTGEIGLFQMKYESGISAGIRRIEAVTGKNAMILLHYKNNLIKKITYLVNSDSYHLFDKMREIMEHTRILEKEMNNWKKNKSKKKMHLLYSNVKKIKNVHCIVSYLHNVEKNFLRTIVDNMKHKIGSGIIFFSTIMEKKILFVACVTKNRNKKIHAGELISEISKYIIGKGGGSPYLAEGWGIDVQSIPKILREVENFVYYKLYL